MAKFLMRMSVYNQVLKFKMKFKTVCGLMAGLLLSTFPQASETELQQFLRTNVLGTSFEMSINVPSEQAKRTEKAVLVEIKRLQQIFSSYDKNSEVSQLNQLGHSKKDGPSSDLVTLVRLCENWQKALPKSFSCQLGKVIDMWRSFEKQQLRPDRIKIRSTARAAQQSSFTIGDLLAGHPNKDFSWNFGGIAKGYILDKAMLVAKASAPKATAIKIDIGGDGVYWRLPEKSTSGWLVGLAIPEIIDDSQENQLGTINIYEGAIAYSGHSSRAHKIGRRSYSHIIAPRDGWPTHNPITAIVKAPDASSADALATALAANEVSSSLDWLSKNPQYAALLIDEHGRQYASSNWYQNYNPANGPREQSIQGYQAKISFTLPNLKVAKYRKPYVAVWVADESGKILKNLLILGQSEQWMSENRSWWRKQGRKTPYLLDGFARPTRRPGQYDVIWDGRDDFGQQLPVGQYHLFVEVVREHGEHEKISFSFELGKEKQTISKKGKKEIDSLTFRTLANNDPNKFVMQPVKTSEK